MDSNDLLSALREEIPGHLALLKQMVEINSHTENPRGVDRLGELTAEWFAELGMTAEFVKDAHPRHGHHLFLEKPGPPDAPQLVLVSHLDTVYTAEEEKEHAFCWREEGDKIYGPGITDIKGGTMLIHLILHTIRHQVPEAWESVHWSVALNAAEEVPGTDFPQRLKERFGRNTVACLVFEGGNLYDAKTLASIPARKGKANFRIDCRGKAAHAGSVHKRGASAIRQLAGCIDQLEALTDYDRGGTVNVGKIGGGQNVNRVPDHAWAEGELRAFDADVFQYLVTGVKSLKGTSHVAAAEGGYRAITEVRLEETSPPWSETTGTAQLLQCCGKAAAAMGFRLRKEPRGGVSDANFTAQSVPTLDGFGWGGGNAHCSVQSADGSREQEYVRRSWLEPKALHGCLCCLELAGHPV